MTSEYDAIVVGGGHNGLVCAFYLARAGRRVLVAEQREVVGGPCSTIRCFPGYRLSYTNSPGSLEPSIVRDMRLLEYGLRFVKPNPSLIVPFPDDRAFVAWRDRPLVEQELAKFSRRDARGYYEVIDFFTSFAESIGVSLFEPPPTLAQLASRLKTAEQEEAFSKVMFGSIADLLDEYLESQEIKAVLAQLALMSNMAAPSTPGTPLMLLMRPLSLASRRMTDADDPRKHPLRGSTGLPLGGMGSITEAMERSIQAMGVDVRTQCEVVRILTRDNRTVGVVFEDGLEVHARVVVSNLNPKTTLLGLADQSELEAGVRQRIDRLQMRGNQFKIALTLDGLPTFAAAPPGQEAAYAGCQFRIGPSLDYMEQAFDDAKYGRWSRSPMLWGLTPSVADPSMAPPGKHVMSINVYHAPYRLAGEGWTTQRDVFGNHCIDILSQYIPNLKDLIIDSKFWSPEDIEAELHLLEANVTHGDMLPSNAFGHRPLIGWSAYRTPIAGLYLCGSGTWPGGYVSGIPGHNAAKQVLADQSAFGRE